MYVLSRIMKSIRIFTGKLSVLVVKFSIYLNRHVFVMQSCRYAVLTVKRTQFESNVLCRAIL